MNYVNNSQSSNNCLRHRRPDRHVFPTPDRRVREVVHWGRWVDYTTPAANKMTSQAAASIPLSSYGCQAAIVTCYMSIALAFLNFYLNY